MGGKKKIDVNAPAAVGGLANPFEALSSTGLPEGSDNGPARAPEAQPPPKSGRVVLRRETSARAGKEVLVVEDFAPDWKDADLDALAVELKKACGCGGTRKDRRIEIQGNPVARVRTLLEQRGFRVAGITS